MKILITGTAGFIGMHLARFLLERGEQVYGIDNLNDYYDVSLKKARNNVLQQYDNYHFFEISLEDKVSVDKVFCDQDIDCIVHLAAQAGVRYSLENPQSYIDTNITGFLNLLEACRHNNIPRIVYASSSNVYGKNETYPFSEKQRVDEPLSLYAVSKRCSELMAYSYSELFDIQTIGLRFFSVYGPWGRPDMALYIFTKAIFEDREISIFNHGNMERDFTFVDDIVKGVSACLYVDDIQKYEIFNLGNHRCEKLMDMISMIEKFIGKEAQKKFLPMQPGDSRKSYAEIDKAKEKLGFEPSTTIEEGIPQFIDWYCKYHNITR
ncbi:GDP-mannose 4,6-dehydratase [Candidatus Uabimicrobium sp. HlEnr_7]|uniref:GDP-mannose 4,6-dehydratase n=1 Tax=Candidatus Uabimicrobium helgolandensis TaxID=3095367 RepID=UPI00355613CA